MDCVIDVLKRNEAISDIAIELEKAYKLKRRKRNLDENNGHVSKTKQAKYDEDSGIAGESSRSSLKRNLDENGHSSKTKQSKSDESDKVVASTDEDTDEAVLQIECTSIPRNAQMIISEPETTKGYTEGYKGLAVIITNTYECTNVPLIGVKKDRSELLCTFKEPHFKRVQVDNALEEDIVKAIQKAAELTRSQSYPCLVIAFSGHGRKGGVIVTEDLHDLPLDNFTDFVHDTIKEDIPKVFLIDACRGSNMPKFRKSNIISKGAPPCYLIASATKDGDKALMREYEKEGSYWMPVVARYVREENKPITDVIEAANRDVKNNPALKHVQEPELVIIGDFPSDLCIYTGKNKEIDDVVESGNDEPDTGDSISNTAATVTLSDEQLKDLKSLVKKTHTGLSDKIKETVENSMNSFSSKLRAKKLIGYKGASSKDYEKVTNEFWAGLRLKSTMKEVESCCKEFLECLYELEGPAEEAGQILGKAWHEEVKKELKISFLV